MGSRKWDSKTLEEIISIIKGIRPESIYLFGSSVTASSHGESDIDLLIVASSDKTPFERRMLLRRMLLDYDRRIGLDLLIYTPEEFEMLKREPCSFVSSAIRKGTKIYERKAS